MSIQDFYFEWLYRIVANDNRYNGISYRQLLYLLYVTDYEPYHSMDVNREQDGLNLRYKFELDMGIKLDCEKKCSVLEMLIALSERMEDQIMDDNAYGNRTSQWFWNMIVSLGLGKMYDSSFDPGYSKQILQDFMHFRYMPSGRGGLFTTSDPNIDMRSIDIWSQCMQYLNEIQGETTW